MIVEKIFQVVSVVIMTFGIVGLPAYFFLDSRRKRLAEEFEEKNDDKELPNN